MCENACTSLEDYLTTLIHQPRNSVVKLALSSLALQLFSRSQNLPKAAVEAAVRYQQLLSATRAELLMLSEKNIDACLLAVTLMTQFEDLSLHTSPALESDHQVSEGTLAPISSHLNGATAILHLWKLRLYRNHPVSNGIKLARRALIQHHLLYGSAPPEWMENGQSFGEGGLDAMYDGILVHITKIRYQLSKISRLEASYMHMSPSRESLLNDLYAKCQDIKLSIEAWSRSFPSNWHRLRHTIKVSDSCPPEGFFSSTAYSYSTFAAGAFWLRDYFLRIVVNDMHLRVLDLLPASSGDSLDRRRATCAYDLEAASNALASTIPFVLGRLIISDAHPVQGRITIHARNRSTPYVIRLVMGPLLLVIRSRYISQELKVWFIAELKSLGKTAGIASFGHFPVKHWPRI